MHSLTEETGAALLQAMKDLTAALQGRSIQPPTPTKRQVDPDYLPGGVEWTKMATPQERQEHNRRVAIQRRKRKEAAKKS